MNNKKVNTLSALGFALSFFCSVPGIVFSIIGLNQIKRYDEGGKIFSILGIIISILRLIILCLLVLIIPIIFYSYKDYFNLDFDTDDISIKEKCRSSSTYCSATKWECSRNGCSCKYDNGYYEEEIYCPSYYFD